MISENYTSLQIWHISIQQKESIRGNLSASFHHISVTLSLTFKVLNIHFLLFVSASRLWALPEIMLADYQGLQDIDG